MGIEPTSKAWEAFVLPLNYARSGREFYDNNRGFEGREYELTAVLGYT